jgi:hypothetical protein
MSNIGLLEVFFENVKTESFHESEYDTAVDIVHCDWIETKYVLQVYKDFFIEIKKTDLTVSKEEMWPEDNFSVHPSNSPSITSTSFSGCSYFYEEFGVQLNICESQLVSIIKAIENKQNQTVMIPFPRDEITTLFDNAFKYRLAKNIDDWKNEVAVAA